MSTSVHARAMLLTLLVVGSLLAGPTVAQEGFSAEVTTYNGQVAVEDGSVTVSGTATGDSDVVVVFVGSRGTTVATAVPVVGDRFSETVSLGDSDGTLEEGFVDGYVFSVGSDGVVGMPGDGPEDPDELVDFADDIEERGLTQDQARDVLQQATVNADASDDLLVEVPFLLARGDLRIADVVPASDREASGVHDVPAGQTMVVRGTTNRAPSNVLIAVEVTDGPDTSWGQVVTDDEWDTDGVWEVEVPVPADAEPGTYTLRADDGERSADVDVAVVEAGAATPTPTVTPDATAQPTDKPATDTTASPTEPTPEPTPEPTAATTTSSPGFGFVAIAGAVLVVGLSMLALAQDHRSRRG